MSFRRTHGVCALLALAFQLSGCIWIDDFGKFKIGDAGEREFPDAGKDSGRSDADAHGCSDEECKRLDSECATGTCNRSTGECEATPKVDGMACFDGNPCTYSDHCSKGVCVGDGLDCSALNDECSEGVCDPETGGCKFGPNRTSQSCDDANACTVNDRCTDDPTQRCRGDNAPKGDKCTDFNSCTGTDSQPDACNDSGHCDPGGNVSSGTSCDDRSDCTTADKCDGDGFCGGTAVREGQPCQEACTSNTVCRSGVCETEDDGAAPAYNKRCLANFCGDLIDVCQDKWKTDLTCQCGCGYQDSACNDCSPYMCTNHGDHTAARWCDKDGKASSNCPDSLKSDGKCDCGCQFADPDCNGGKCCSGTGDKGCDDSYVEECVCQRSPNGDPSCCETEWTDRCAQLAVNLGCMLCP